jgi:hypothetical protein
MYIFVVDTEQYAGNFERAMCAYITGQVGQCTVGEECATTFEEEVDLDENLFDLMVEQVPDEHGCHRPCSIYPTPGWFNNGLGQHYREGVPGVEEKAKEDHRKQCEEKIANGENVPFWEKLLNKPLEKCPAYFSVAIFFNRQPPDLLIELMKNRAQHFALKLKVAEEEWIEANRLKYTEPMTITGFRLLKTVETTEEMETWPL